MGRYSRIVQHHGGHRGRGAGRGGRAGRHTRRHRVAVGSPRRPQDGSGRPLPDPPRCCKSTWEWSGHMSTCTRSRRDEGMSAFGEVRRTAIEHGAPWSRMRSRRGRPPPPSQSRTGPARRPRMRSAGGRAGGRAGWARIPRPDLICTVARPAGAIRSAPRGPPACQAASLRRSAFRHRRRPPVTRAEFPPPAIVKGGDLTSHPSPDLRRSGTYLRSPSGPGACIERRRGSRWHTPSGQGT